MKAAQINQYGDPSVVTIYDIDKPIISAGQVLVEVHASSLNPFDTAIRAGYMKEMIPLQFPVTLGGDIAGVVVEVAEGITNVAVGDKVYGQANVVAGNSGAFAEFAATAAGQVAKAPQNLDANQAASVVLVGVSAWQGLTQHINLQSGQKVFIHGGAGGIGAVAIQIAKNIGAHVATTATGEGINYVKKLGADEVIDYKSQDFAESLKDYDAAFDTVGGDDFNKTLTILKKGGIAVSMIAQADQTKAEKLGITAMTESTKVTTEALDILRGLIEGGVVTPQIGQTFSLNQTAEAFTARESGSVRGKVVLEIKVA
jgi:alcohol dehydrogenase